MRREYFTLEVTNVGWVEEDEDPAKPTVTIDFEGPANPLESRLTVDEEELLDAESIDVAFRLQDPIDEEEATGVVSVTHRLTGDFILELNEEAEDVLTFIAAARRYGEADADEGRYCVAITTDGDEVVTYDKDTFLIYDEEGNLLRNHSLIPSGVEL